MSLNFLFEIAHFDETSRTLLEKKEKKDDKIWRYKLIKRPLRHQTNIAHVKYWKCCPRKNVYLITIVRILFFVFFCVFVFVFASSWVEAECAYVAVASSNINAWLSYFSYVKFYENWINSRFANNRSYRWYIDTKSWIRTTTAKYVDAFWMEWSRYMPYTPKRPIHTLSILTWYMENCKR